MGAVVQIIRSGDVIPKVEKVVKPAKNIKMPSSSLKYKWNKTKKDFILEDPEHNDTVLLKSIEIFFAKLDVAGLGRGNVKRIINKGHKTFGILIRKRIRSTRGISYFIKSYYI